MKKLWFKNKHYGWGWYPASWEGWAVLAVWIGFFALGEVLFVKAMNATEGAGWVTAVFMVYTVVIVSALIAVSYIKGEKPEWRWGNKPVKKAAPPETPAQQPPTDDAAQK